MNVDRDRCVSGNSICLARRWRGCLCIRSRPLAGRSGRVGLDLERLEAVPPLEVVVDHLLRAEDLRLQVEAAALLHAVVGVQLLITIVKKLKRRETGGQWPVGMSDSDAECTQSPTATSSHHHTHACHVSHISELLWRDVLLLHTLNVENLLRLIQTHATCTQRTNEMK